MPALPWTSFSPPDPDRGYVVMASRLPLARYRDTPAFLLATMAIRGQLRNATGLIGYALDAHLARKTFYTVSAWDSQDALEAFSHADPHRSRVSVIRTRMQPTTFTFWTVHGADLPVSWTEARRRIAEGGPALACGMAARRARILAADARIRARGPVGLGHHL